MNSYTYAHDQLSTHHYCAVVASLTLFLHMHAMAAIINIANAKLVFIYTVPLLEVIQHFHAERLSLHFPVGAHWIQSK